MRNTDEYADYETYIKKKSIFIKKYRVLGTIYALLWLFDYSLQIFYQLNRIIGSDRIIIIDRYIYDVAINISITADWAIEVLPLLLNIIFKIHPKPDIVIYLDLPEETAFSRKNDIQSIEYLKERRIRYLWLTEHFGFQLINATWSIDRILDKTIEILNLSDRSRASV